MHNQTATAVRCERCSGTGIAVWGAIINGVPQKSGVCFRCGGKGHQTPADQRRNWNYDNYIRR